MSVRVMDRGIWNEYVSVRIGQLGVFLARGVLGRAFDGGDGVDLDSSCMLGRSLTITTGSFAISPPPATRAKGGEGARRALENGII